MKLLSIITKSLREQLRSYWLLLLSLSMGPFFIFVYFLIIESSQVHYKIQIVNNDKGVTVNNQIINHGRLMVSYFVSTIADTSSVPFEIEVVPSRELSVDAVKQRKVDALIVIPDSFSSALQKRINQINDSISVPEVEFVGDLTNTRYLLSAVYANEIINEYTLDATHAQRTVIVKETALGTSASINEFDMVVPGILIVSLIMLMFTASIAFVSEVEHKTILRLKLSKLTAFEFLGGISIVQLMVGFVSVLLTLLTAIMLGFEYQGSLFIMTFIAVLTSLSLIAFSLIIAAATRSANEVLVVGNLPMFLFMFFTGAVFPLHGKALFTIAGYPVNVQGLMTPTHAISALNKTLIMNMSFREIIPEMVALLLLTIVYFLIGGYLFKTRHLKLN